MSESGPSFPFSPRDRDLMAAEYVLGLLRFGEAQAFEAWAERDPEVALAIEDWERRLDPLADLAEPVTPPPEVWERIVLSAGLTESAASPPLTYRRRLLEAIRKRLFWRIAGSCFASGMVGAAIAFSIVAPKLVTSQPAVASLSVQGAPMPAYLVMVTKDGYATIIANAAEVQPGNSLELWGFPEGTERPVRLGLLPTSGKLRMPAIVPAGTVLRVTSEPEGGSPTGAPTGPVVYTGRMVRG